MVLKFNENSYNLTNLSFSDSHAWFYIDGNEITYNDILKIFSDLDLEVVMEIYTDENDFLESHIGFNYLESVTYNQSGNMYIVELTKEPITQRVLALEETIDLLLQSGLSEEE